MHWRSAALGALWMFANAGAAFAQGTVTVESKLTVALKIEMTQPAGDVGDANTNIKTVSFSTKDILNLAADLTNRDDLDSLVVRRMSNAVDNSPNPEILGDDIVILDKDGRPVALQGSGLTITERQLPVADLSQFLNRRAADIRDTGDLGIAGRKDIRIEAAELRLQGTGNDLRFGLVGRNESSAERKTDDGRNLGLLFESRNVQVEGGAELDVASSELDDELDGRGVVSGTIKASGEQRLGGNN